MVTRYILAVAVLVPCFLAGCQPGRDKPAAEQQRLQVVTTLFPLYDFARNIGGDKADVSLLLPPGTEPHSYEPKPDDMVRINRAALFIYTNRFMEPWAERILKSSTPGRPEVVDASSGLTLADIEGEGDHGGHAVERHGGVERKDPHVWLDFANAGRMVDTLLAAFVAKAPAHRSYFEANAASYKMKLAELDGRYRAVLGSCRSRTLLHGGHYAFGYLARRYALTYLAASGVAADAEPSPARLAELVKQIRKLGLRAVFAEELVSPRVAETIASETGAEVLRLHAGHNISRDELARGVTFLSLMEANLAVLEKGLQCNQ